MTERARKIFNIFYVPVTFFLVALVIEHAAVFATSGSWYIRSPWLYLTITGFLSALLFLIPKGRTRFITSAVFLGVLFAVDLVFVVIYAMTGTIFDFSMLMLTGDAMAIMESVDLEFNYIAAGGVVLAGYIVFGGLPVSGVTTSPGKMTKTIVPIALAGIVTLHALLGAAVATSNVGDPYLTEKLYGKSFASYADRGPIGNFAAELYRGFLDDNEPLSADEIEEIVYSSQNYPTKYFARAKDYNVVTILSESLEWFAFMRDDEAYPNGFHLGESELRELYPNLYRLYDSSFVMTNFHSREKTDISENISIMGSYPLYSYVNYDYPNNNVAYSLPSILNTLYGVKSMSFHNNVGTFYNRDKYLTGALGFDEFVSAEEMAESGMTDYTAEGGRNLDSEMMETCKARMFPSDRRFNTYITTLTMHGQYSYRENLEKYYERLDAHGITPIVEDTEQLPDPRDVFRYYAAAAMEFDAAIGVMLDYLDEQGLADKTMIVLFGDHNSYYQNLSSFVKEIDGTFIDEKNVTELFRVPLMIRVGKGEKQATEVDKFTCTADILPTILDLLGIHYFDSLYYGTSVFASGESLLYSRAYDIFMTDKIYFSTLNNIRWQSPSLTRTDLAAVERKGLELMKRTACVNAIFARDYFTGSRLTNYRRELRRLNPA